MPPKQYPFTKRCADAGVVTLEPDDEWFTERSLPAPPGRADRMEVFASHAWAYSSCDLSDDDAVVTAWGLLSKRERDYLLSKCKNPLARSGEGVMASAVRYLTWVRAPVSRAASAAPASQVASSPPFPSSAGGISPGGASPSQGDLTDPTFAAKVRKSLAHLSPSATLAFLSGGSGAAATPPPPAVRAVAAAPPSGYRDSAGASVLHDELEVTFGQVSDRLGPALVGVFDIVSLPDWTKGERSDFWSKSRDIRINSDAAKAYGWHIKVPLLVPRGPHARAPPPARRRSPNPCAWARASPASPDTNPPRGTPARTAPTTRTRSFKTGPSGATTAS